LYNPWYQRPKIERMTKEKLIEIAHVAAELGKETLMLGLLFSYAGVAVYDVALLLQYIEATSDAIEFAILVTALSVITIPYVKRNLWDYRE
jgi:hypothetical protein